MPRQFAIYNDGNRWQFEKASRTNVPASRQIGPDRFEEFYDQFGLIRPPYNFDLLTLLAEQDTWHRRAIELKASESTGLGWDIVKDPRFKGEPKESDREHMTEFFTDCTEEDDLEDLLTAVWKDFDSLGDGAIEVVRNGKGEPDALYHIPFRTVRVYKGPERLFAQVRGVAGPGTYRRIQWFREFGWELGDNPLPAVIPVGQTPSEPPSSVGNIADLGELIHFFNYDGKSSFYGLPHAISAIGAMAGNQATRDYNLGRLVNRGIPDYIMALDGVELDEEVQAQIKEFLDRSKEKKLEDGPKILTLELDGGTASFERVTPEKEDGSWTEYRHANRDEILAAHGVPKHRLGIMDAKGSSGQSMATEQNKIYASTVVRRRRRRMERILTRRIIRQGFGIDGWMIRFTELDIRNEAEEADMDFQRTGGVPVETLNEVRRKRGLGPDLDGGDRVVMRVGHAVVDIGTLPGGSYTPESQPVLDPTTPSVNPNGEANSVAGKPGSKTTPMAGNNATKGPSDPTMHGPEQNPQKAATSSPSKRKRSGNDPSAPEQAQEA